jgi:hypothetical protein
MSAIVEVEAPDLDTAIAKVENDEVTVNVDNDGEYVPSSFEVVYEISHDLTPTKS